MMLMAAIIADRDYVDYSLDNCYYRNVNNGRFNSSNSGMWQAIKSVLRWLTPGLGVKRWITLVLAGVTFLGTGLALFLLDLYRTAPETWWLPIVSLASLRFLDRSLRILIFGGIGLGVILYGIWGLNRALLRPFIRPGRQVVDQLATFRRRERGPRIVVIGGGHGLATLLRGLKEHTHNMTAVVTVADDGGSSGELRRSLGVLPPGDIRNCLAALSDDEALLAQLFQYRFVEGSGLGGHSFGNLFITALSEITGSFEEAIAESGRVLGVHGRVLPATLHNVQLVADVQLPHVVTEVRIAGESSIPKLAGRVRRVWLEPNNPPAFPPVLQALLNADLIVVGPGSLYTSILPNLLVPDISAALRSSRALKIFVCNIATQDGETAAYSCLDHLQVLEEYIGEKTMDIAVCNNSYFGALPDGTAWVKMDVEGSDPRVYLADLVDRDQPWRHEAEKLATTLIDLLMERTGPLLA